LCRTASAAAQADDLPAARTLLEELQRIEGAAAMRRSSPAT
jgi:hypothetical protein